MCLSILTIAQMALGMGMNFPPGGADAPEPGSFDEFFLNTIANMDEKELEELAKLGEQIAKDMEAQGIDVDEFLRDQLGGDMPTMPQMPSKTTEPAQTPEPSPTPIPTEKEPSAEELRAPKLDKDKQAQIAYLLRVITEKLPELQRQAANDISYQEDLEVWNSDIDNVLYFAQLLRQARYAKYLVLDEFQELFSGLNQLSTVLEQQEPRLYIPDPELEHHDPFARLGLPKRATTQEIEQAYRKAIRKTNPARVQSDLEEAGITGKELKEKIKKAEKQFAKIEKAYYETQRRAKSRMAFNTILQTFFFTLENILKDMQKLLKAYDPEALKIKEEQEKRQAEAKQLAEEAARKEPPYAPYVFDQPTFDYTPPTEERYIPPTPPSYDYPNTQEQARTPQPATFGSSAEREGSQAPQEKKEKKLTPKEKEQKAKETKEKELKKKEKADVKQQELEVKIKLASRKESFEKLAQFFNEIPTTQKDKRLKLFANFDKYLTTNDITPPYDKGKSLANLTRAAEINQAIENLSTSFQGLKADIARDLASIPEGPKKKYKKDLKDIYTKYNDNYFKKDLKELLKIKVDRVKKELISFDGKKYDRSHPISKEKKYLHFGINEYPASTATPGANSLDDPENQVIKNMNFNPRTQQAFDLVARVTELYKQLDELITKNK